MKTIKIKEIGIEVTYPKTWTKPYNKIEIPEGWRMIRVLELFFILDGSKYMNKFLGKLKGKWNYFWCEQTHCAKRIKASSALYLECDLDLKLDSWGFKDSIEGGRVVFCRSLK